MKSPCVVWLIVLLAVNARGQNIVGGLPGAPSFTGTVTAPSLDLSGITGSVQCLQASTTGLVSGTGAACGGGSLAYPASGIPNSTGSAWGISYATTGSGSVLALANSPTFTTPNLGTPSALVLTNATGLPNAGVIGLGTFATQNYATPPAIGGTTPAAGSFTSLIDTGVNGLTQCLQANSSGVVSGTGAACGGSGATPGGSSGQVQYNNAGTFGGASGATIIGGVMTLTTPNIGAATGASLSVTGQLTSTAATGTAPLVVSSTTNVPNLNASTLTGSAIGASGSSIPLLSGANSWGGLQTFSNGVTIGGSRSIALSAASSILGGSSAPIVIVTSPAACTVAGVTTCTVTKTTGTASTKYTLTAGTPAGSTITLAMPTASNGWICDGVDITTTGRLTQTADSTTAPVLTNYNAAGTPTNPTAGDTLLVKCTGY